MYSLKQRLARLCDSNGEMVPFLICGKLASKDVMF